jgi:ribosomal-protein-alanine N-acetyltransferase
MRAIGTITLETPRLVLRKASVEDASNMFNNWANDPEVTKFLTWKPHQNIEVTRNVLADWVRHYDSPLYMHWLIQLKAINQVIGSIGIVNMDEAELEAEVDYCISRQYWNQGITSEALDAVIRYLVSARIARFSKSIMTSTIRHQEK